jgi:hypothetical protein
VSVRDFIFVIYLASGETVAGTLAAIKQIAIGQFDLLSDGGKQLISSSINGQQYSFSLSGSLTNLQIIALARRAYLVCSSLNDTTITDYINTIDESFTQVDFSRLEP